MKKLLSFLAVSAIVTSAFAFTNITNKNKSVTFCVLNVTRTACVIIRNKAESTTGTQFKHFPQGPGKWDGTSAGCTNASPVTGCIVIIILIDN